jgi:carbamoyltransferase
MSYILGLSGGYYHDAAACLVKDGQIVAFVEEERLTRRKHNMDSKSSCCSAAFCLAKAGIKLEEVEAIAISWNPIWPDTATYTEDKDLIQEILNPYLFNGYTPHRLEIVEHHLAHAASAFYCSGFKEANILVVDGSGDGMSTSLAYGTSTGIEFIKKYDFTQSLGWFYESITEHIGLGTWHNTGKLMGLAAYGEPKYNFDFISPTSVGYKIDLSKFGMSLSSDIKKEYGELEYYWRLKKTYQKALESFGIKPQLPKLEVDANHLKSLNKTEFNQLHKNVAASAQKKLEDCIIALAEGLISTTNNGFLCLAGGVGLNCSANGKLWNNPLVKSLYIQPASGDNGGAIGAALEISRRRGYLKLPSSSMQTTYLGPSFSNEVIYKALANSGLSFNFENNIEYKTAEALSKGAIVGWFQGAMEGGPRALGNRSILADPRYIENRNYINSEIKTRELWRPLAPSILHSHIQDYVVNIGPCEFMIVAYQASQLAQNKIPATIHIDNTLRPQSVSKATNPLYSSLIEAFEQITGVPVVLNTSFNQNEEPIVCTPLDAIRAFCSIPLDALAIGQFFVTKNNSHK